MFVRRRWRWLVMVPLGVALAVELFARLYLGLGDPGLVQTHPTIEYYFRPNQRAHPFGNLFRTNRYGMRSDDFPPQRTQPGELRVLVFGDSVVNGGNLTDHSRLATTLLQHRLAQELHRPVIVGNVSAGSWGPPNQLAYIKQFGFLDADVAIFVLSSSDFNDAPTFEPLNPLTHPTKAPWSAAWEGFVRYLPRYIHSRPSSGTAPEPVNLRDVEVCMQAEREFLALARAAGVTAMVLQHWEFGELSQNQPQQGHKEILRVATEAGVPVYQDVELLRQYLATGRNPYRDGIHLNDNGQQAYLEILHSMLEHDAADRIKRP
jgi:hypothetical protein